MSKFLANAEAFLAPKKAGLALAVAA